MRKIVCVLFVALLAFSSRADEREARLRALIGRLPRIDAEDLAKAKYAGHYALGRLVSYSNHDGRVAAVFHLPSELVKQFEDPAPLLLSIEGSPDVWSIHRRKNGTLDEGLSLITLTCFAPNEAGAFNRFALSSDGQVVTVAGTQMFGHPLAHQGLSMTQLDRSVRFNWRLERDRWASRKTELPDLAAFHSRFPEIEADFLMPILRMLGPARPACDVYGVFDRIPADPGVSRRIMPLIARLDSNDAGDRDAAAAAIKAMGDPAILACMRLDRTFLTPEQTNRLKSLCAAEGWVHLKDIEAARHDVEFLSSCMRDDDPAVRTAAANLLGAARIARQLGNR